MRITYHDLVNKDGSFNRSVIMRIVWWRVGLTRDVYAKRGMQGFDLRAELAIEMKSVWEQAKAQKQSEFLWRNWVPSRTAA